MSLALALGLLLNSVSLHCPISCYSTKKVKNETEAATSNLIRLVSPFETIMRRTPWKPVQTILQVIEILQSEHAFVAFVIVISPDMLLSNLLTFMACSLPLLVQARVQLQPVC